MIFQNFYTIHGDKMTHMIPNFYKNLFVLVAFCSKINSKTSKFTRQISDLIQQRHHLC